MGLVATLAACGGGDTPAGGGGPANNAAPVASAGTARTLSAGSSLVLDGSSSSDAEGAALSYSWSLASKPAGSSATLAEATTARPTLTADTAGLYTLQLVVSDGQAQSVPATVSVTATPATPPQIVTSSTEPLSGTVTLSLQGEVGGAVTWYADLRLLGSGGSSTGSPITWNTNGVSNGEHLLIARIQTSADTYREVRRTVVVGNSPVTLSASVSGSSGTVFLDARAGSPNGVGTVSAVFKGVSLGSLSAPNACSRWCSGANDVYRFSIDAAQAGSGTHSALVTATDLSGQQRTVTLSVPISNPAALTLDTPADGSIVQGSLAYAGSASSDKGGPVTVRVRLGDLPLLETTSPSFSGSYNLAGVPAGSYTLTVTATDSSNQVTTVTRNVVVASSPALTLTPLFTLPSGGSLLASDGAQILYRAPDGGVLLRAGADVALNGAAALQYATDWQVSGGYVYVEAKGTDCTPTFNCIYEWNSAGVRRNLSALSPYTAGATYQVNPVARDGRVVWTNWNGPNPGSYTAYDALNQSFSKISQPAGVNYVGNTDYDLAVVNGVLRFFFWGQTGGEGTSSRFDVFDGATRLSAGSGRNIYPQTDGVRVAWQQSPVGGTADGSFTLMVQPLSGGGASAVSTAATRFMLRDGVLAWIEKTGASQTLKASTGGAANTLSSQSSASLLGVAGGHVVFSERGKVYTWKASSGQQTLKIDTVPAQTLTTPSGLIFSLGNQVYRTALD